VEVRRKRPEGGQVSPLNPVSLSPRRELCLLGRIGLTGVLQLHHLLGIDT
jgi:hypothetical protein